MSSWLGSLTFAKFAYVLIIALLIVVLFRELYGVHWNNTLYVGNFDYFTDGKPNSEQSKSFPAYVQGQHQLLRAALIEENRRRESAENLPGIRYHRSLPSDLPEAARWTSILVDADLKVQGFDIGKVLSTLRARVSPPAQINGFVEKSGELVRAAVNYPPRNLADGQHTPSSPFETGVLNGDASTALAIAASIVWTQAAEVDKGFEEFPGRCLFPGYWCGGTTGCCATGLTRTRHGARTTRIVGSRRAPWSTILRGPRELMPKPGVFGRT